MPDLFDHAQAREETDRAAAIAAARRHAPDLPYIGCCYWCSEITADGRRFCDADCRDDWQEMQRMKER